MWWFIVLLLCLSLPVAVAYLKYRRDPGRMSFRSWCRRVWAVGRITYIRFYPNPGIGIALPRGRRLAVSVIGGLEVFRRHPNGTWMRTRAYGSRIPSRGNGGR